ncbi:MAG TPA: S8 family serine peptidase [Acidimicrobiia bacterium]
MRTRAFRRIPLLVLAVLAAVGLVASGAGAVSAAPDPSTTTTSSTSPSAPTSTSSATSSTTTSTTTTTTAAPGAVSTTPAAPAPPALADDRLVVGLEPGASTADAGSIARDVGATNPQVVDDRTIVVDAASGVTRALRAEGLRRDQRVRYVEPNYRVSGSFTPNDPALPSLRTLLNAQPGGIRAEGAWDTTLGSRSVVVGILDSGIDAAHPDLMANLWSNRLGIGGCAYGTHGYNAFTKQCTTTDPYGHGTHVAGILGAVGNNRLGITGVAPRVSLMSLTMLDHNGDGSIAGAIGAIDWAVQAKNAGVNLRVLSASWGGDGFSQGLTDAIQRAGAAGILFVTAAGNSSANVEQQPVYPCAAGLPNVICVAASGGDDKLTSFSDFGPNHVDLAAPGQGIVSTVPPGVIPGCGVSLYCSLDGTSMATPMVSGAAALAVAAQPDLTETALRTVIVHAVDPQSNLSGKVVSGGRLDVCKAVPGCGLVAKPPSAPTAVHVAVGHGQATLTWSAPDSNGNGTGVTGYTVTAPDGVHSLGTSARTLTISGLVDNQDAQFAVQAGNAAGPSTAVPATARSLSGGYVVHAAGRLARVVVTTGPKPSAPSPTDLGAGNGQARGVALLPDGTGGYVLDQFGQLHPFGVGGDPAPPAVTGAWVDRSRDWARGVAILPDASGGYVLDGFGHLLGFSIGDHARPPGVSGGPQWRSDLGRGVAIAASGQGGYLVDAHGALYRFAIGGASLPPKQSRGISWPTEDMARGITLVRGGSGGYVVDRSGGLHPFRIGGAAPEAPVSGAPWPGLDRARGVAF